MSNLLVITLRLRPNIDYMNSYIEVYGALRCSSAIKSIIEQIRQAFNAKLVPKLTEDGTSGAYRMRNI